jgi:hypothetical protein
VLGRDRDRFAGRRTLVVGAGHSARARAPLIDPNLHSCGTVPPHGVDELTHPEAG